MTEGMTGAELMSIVGDSETVYKIEVESWLERMNLDAPATRAAYRLFSSADAPARDIFGIEYEGAQAARFELPMALILAVKPV